MLRRVGAGASTAALVLTALGTAGAATLRMRPATTAASPTRLLAGAVSDSVVQPEPRAGQHSSSWQSTRTADATSLDTVRARLIRADSRVPAAEVDRWIVRLSTEPALRRGLEDALGRMTRYEGLIRGALRQRGLPEDLLYVVMVESGFREGAVSHAGAVGMWQFMPATGRMYDLEVSAFVDERRDPVKSTHAAARHLRDLHAEFGSWHLALAAYNAGGGRVATALRRYAGGRRGSEVLYWQIRAHLPRETRRYVPQYLAASEIARNPRAFGLTPQPLPELAFLQVWVPGGVSLDAVAQHWGAPAETVRHLNPHLIRGVTPPGRHWPVRLPPRSAGPDRAGAEP